MDPNIKEELLDEIRQLDIKKEENFYGVTSTAKALKLSIEIGQNVQLTVDRVGIEAGPSNYLYHSDPEQRHYTAEFKGSKAKFVLLHMNRGNQEEKSFVNLSVEFDNVDEAFKFSNDLKEVGYSPQ